MKCKPTLTVPVGQPLIDAISLCYQAGQAILLEGSPGVGKSEVIAEAARRLQVGCLVRDLSLMEAPDLGGLPVVVDGMLSYATPAFLPRDGAGFLLFEELNRAPRQVTTPCLQLLTARCLNDYQLPSRWLPMAAINPSDGEGIYADDLDAALLSRFCKIRVVADVTLWLEWAHTNRIHPAVIRFVRDTPDIFHSPGSNPRAWTYVSRILMSASDQTSAQALRAAVTGLVGEDLATACLAYLSNREDVPDPRLLIEKYPKVREMVTERAKAGATDFISSLIHRLLTALQDPSTEKAVLANRKWLANVRTLTSDLPAEFRAKVTTRHSWCGDSP